MSQQGEPTTRPPAQPTAQQQATIRQTLAAQNTPAARTTQIIQNPASASQVYGSIEAYNQQQAIQPQQVPAPVGNAPTPSASTQYDVNYLGQTYKFQNEAEAQSFVNAHPIYELNIGGKTQQFGSTKDAQAAQANYLLTQIKQINGQYAVSYGGQTYNFLTQSEAQSFVVNAIGLNDVRQIYNVQGLTFVDESAAQNFANQLNQQSAKTLIGSAKLQAQNLAAQVQPLPAPIPPTVTGRTAAIGIEQEINAQATQQAFQAGLAGKTRAIGIGNAIATSYQQTLADILNRPNYYSPYPGTGRGLQQGLAAQTSLAVSTLPQATTERFAYSAGLNAVPSSLTSPLISTDAFGKLSEAEQQAYLAKAGPSLQQQSNTIAGLQASISGQFYLATLPPQLGGRPLSNAQYFYLQGQQTSLNALIAQYNQESSIFNQEAGTLSSEIKSPYIDTTGLGPIQTGIADISNFFTRSSLGYQNLSNTLFGKATATKQSNLPLAFGEAVGGEAAGIPQGLTAFIANLAGGKNPEIASTAISYVTNPSGAKQQTAFFEKPQNVGYSVGDVLGNFLLAKGLSGGASAVNQALGITEGSVRGLLSTTAVFALEGGALSTVAATGTGIVPASGLVSTFLLSAGFGAGLSLAGASFARLNLGLGIQEANILQEGVGYRGLVFSVRGSDFPLIGIQTEAGESSLVAGVPKFESPNIYAGEYAPQAQPPTVLKSNLDVQIQRAALSGASPDEQAYFESGYKLASSLRNTKFPVPSEFQLELRSLSPEENQTLTNYLKQPDVAENVTIYGSSTVRALLGEQFRLGGDIDIQVLSAEPSEASNLAKQIVSELNQTGEPRFEVGRTNPNSVFKIGAEKIVDIHALNEVPESGAQPETKLGFPQQQAIQVEGLRVRSVSQSFIDKANTALLPQTPVTGSETGVLPLGRSLPPPEGPPVSEVRISQGEPGQVGSVEAVNPRAISIGGREFFEPGAEQLAAETVGHETLHITVSELAGPEASRALDIPELSTAEANRELFPPSRILTSGEALPAQPVENADFFFGPTQRRFKDVGDFLSMSKILNEYKNERLSPEIQTFESIAGRKGFLPESNAEPTLRFGFSPIKETIPTEEAPSVPVGVTPQASPLTASPQAIVEQYLTGRPGRARPQTSQTPRLLPNIQASPVQGITPFANQNRKAKPVGSLGTAASVPISIGISKGQAQRRNPPYASPRPGIGQLKGINFSLPSPPGVSQAPGPQRILPPNNQLNLTPQTRAQYQSPASLPPLSEYNPPYSYSESKPSIPGYGIPSSGRPIPISLFPEKKRHGIVEFKQAGRYQEFKNIIHPEKLLKSTRRQEDLLVRSARKKGRRGLTNITLESQT